ncbi:hypothetical protein [Brevibacillus sp. IT-7CA2]|uniref:hypothetical protein n=1 Tax=Brevibacillus sp. IT-7CA2 TaxID=3026436 RepID=UPI0039DFF06F
MQMPLIMIWLFRHERESTKTNEEVLSRPSSCTINPSKPLLFPGITALLVIKMISGLEKEFELTAAEIARKDYVAFSKIQSFEVMEYNK